MHPAPPRAHLLSCLRARVTGASPSYVGSVTLSAVLCRRAHLHHRQLVQIRVARTAVELWTYVIRAPDTEPSDTVCVNGAAALHVTSGDVVVITAFARSGRPLPRPMPVCDALEGAADPPARDMWSGDDVLVEVVTGKIHRPRVTRLVEAAACPCVVVDWEWMRQAGMDDGVQVQVVNVTSGQRDVLIVRRGQPGSRVCEMHMSGGQVRIDGPTFEERRGYSVGDVIIIMAYAEVSTERLKAGQLPKMNLCFPFEIPEKDRRNCQTIFNAVPS